MKMGDHSVKRLKIESFTVYPDFSRKTTSTELFTGSDNNTNDHIPAPNNNVADIHDINGPTTAGTSYQDRMLEQALQWENSREELLDAYFESMMPTPWSKCAECAQDIAQEEHVRCQDCGGHTFFCSIRCVQVTHNGNQLFLHKPKLWKSEEKLYTPINLEIHLRREDHCCSGQYIRSGIQVFDPQGRLHSVNITTCPCESNAATFIRHQLWSSTTESPRVAFHIELLQWMHYLTLEARTLMTAICQTIRWRNNLTIQEFDTLYRAIIGEAFDQYRYFQHKVQTMEHVSHHLTDNVTCPACPKESGKIFISLDANFGLVRKMNSRTSPLEPKHSGKIFVESTQNEELSVAKNDRIDKDTVCSNFQAGSNLRSKNKAAKLDITGVFGSCCRHGVPHTFMNLDRGERLTYSIFVIDKLLDEVSGTGVKLNILYDIACLLDRHIQVNQDKTKYSAVSFSVPAFHAFAHKASCQVNYGTQWLPGFGLTDGEEMERIWSYLRRFSVITKEMTPSHRVDLLTDGLLNYRHKKISDIELSLAKNRKRALCIINGTRTELNHACKELSTTTSKVDDWIKKEREEFSQGTLPDEPISEEETYVNRIMTAGNMLDMYRQCDAPEDQNKLQKQYKKLQKDIGDMEKKIGIKRRWTTTENRFQRTKKSLEEKKKRCLIRKLHRQAMEYRFTIDLKSKYSDGQAIANRLSQSLQRISKRIRTSIDAYNDSKFEFNSGLPSTVTWATAVNTSSEMYAKADINRETSDTVPYTERRRLMDLRNRHNRAVEELKLNEDDMLAVLKDLESKCTRYQQVITECGNQCNGVLTTLQEKAELSRKKLLRAHTIFKTFLDIPQIPDHLSNTYVLSTEDLDNELRASDKYDIDEEDEEDTIDNN